MTTRAIHHRPRLTTPTVAQLQDTWTELHTELSITPDPGEARLIRERIEQVEQQAARLIESEAKP